MQPFKLDSSDVEGVQTQGGDPVHARRWWILAVLGIAQLMIVLDITVVNIALPSAQRALHFSNDSREWIVTAYALAFGSLLLAGGRLGDLFGRKRLFVASTMGFAAASVVGGAAQSFGVLVAARGVQGVFAALMAPAALSLVSTTFTDPRERATAFGIWGAIGGAGAAIGLLLGGALTQDLSWRWTMFVNLGFAIVAAVGAVALLRRDVRSAREPIDVPGTVTATGGLFALVSASPTRRTTAGDPRRRSVSSRPEGTARGVRRDPDPRRAPIDAAAGRARPQPRRVVPRPRDRRPGQLRGVLFSTYYLQEIKGDSPIRTGLAFLPLSAALVIAATVANARLLPRTGPRTVMASGMALAMIGMGLFAQLGVRSSYAAHLLPALLVLGVGLGFLYAPRPNRHRGVDPATRGSRPVWSTQPTRSAGRSASRSSAP